MRKRRGYANQSAPNRCMHCPHCSDAAQTKSFVDAETNKEYKKRDFINCNTTFVIYHLTCPCAEGFFYIGRTKIRMRDRLADSLLRIQGVKHVKPLPKGGDGLKRLNQRVTFWIHQLDAVHPGLNEDIDFTCIL